MNASRLVAATLLAGVFAATTACSGTSTKSSSGDAGTASSGSTAGTGAAAAPKAAPAAPKPAKSTIYFDYDKSNLDSGDTAVLAGWAAYLAANPGVKVTLEGHCDSRGSNAYNLSLGERRAISARDYLTSSGVSAKQVSIVSYGEERPAVAGNNESAWSKNRRVEVVLR